MSFSISRHPLTRRNFFSASTIAALTQRTTIEPVGSQNSSGESFAVSKPFESGGSRCFLPLVAMMKATISGQSDNSGLRRRAVLDWPPDRRISQASVDSVGASRKKKAPFQHHR